MKKRGTTKETLIKMAEKAGFEIEIDGAVVRLKKGERSLNKIGYRKAYDFLRNEKVKSEKAI